MGNGMDKILTGIYVGNYRGAKDEALLTEHGITHILSIHDTAKPLVQGKVYLCIKASDVPGQELTQFFPECIDFIHRARRENGHVLIHCLAGVSRSVTVTAAYIMTVTKLGWRDAVNVVRAARNGANPNFGFQKQLQNYQCEGLDEARTELLNKYPDTSFDYTQECEAALKCFRHFVQTGDRVMPTELYTLPYKAYGDRRKGKDGNAEAGPSSSNDRNGTVKDSHSAEGTEIVNGNSSNDRDQVTETVGKTAGEDGEEDPSTETSKTATSNQVSQESPRTPT